MVAPSYSCIRPERVGHLIGTARHVTQTDINISRVICYDMEAILYERYWKKIYFLLVEATKKTQSRNIMQSYSRVLPSEMEEGHSCAHK